MSRRSATAEQHYPARWIDVSVDAETAHAAVAAVVAQHDYSPTGTSAGDIRRYRFGSPGLEFLSDAVGFGLVLRALGRPDGWAELVAFTHAGDGGVRLTVSLVEGVFHARVVAAAIEEIVDTFRRDGVLVDSSEPFSGLDLPPDSPGRPRLHRRR